MARFLTMLLLGGGKITTIALLIYQQFSTTQDVGVCRRHGQRPAVGQPSLCFAAAIPDAATSRAVPRYEAAP